jgi:hypothetical protein
MEVAMEPVREVEGIERVVAEKISREIGPAGVDVHGLVRQAFDEVLRPMGEQRPHYLLVRFDPGEAALEQAYRDLAERLPELMQRRRKRLEERQIEALLEAFAPAQPDDEAGKALVMDNLLARQRFLEEVPCLTSKEVAALAGHTARNVSMTASRWKQAGKIFSVPGPREDLYPAFQFQDGKPHPTVARALAELPKRKSPWQVAFWFVSGNGWLDGAAPAERLADGDTVVAAARHEAEDIIG